MRELTKAIGSFSWALSLFGARQALSLLRQPFPGSDRPASRAFDRVADSAGAELGGWLRGVYEAGDRAQRGFVDLFFGAASSAATGAGAASSLGDLPGRAREVAEDAWQASRRAFGGVSTGSGPAAPAAAPTTGTTTTTPGAAPGGWGPMPPLPDVPELRDDRSGGCCG
jgi:hypothetical protein